MSLGLPERLVYWSAQFDDFLKFEWKVFTDSLPIANYDPSLIRYGEYRFVLDTLPVRENDFILDLGCEANIFMLYLASRGCRLLGIDLNPAVWLQLHERKSVVEKTLRKKLDVSFQAQDAIRLPLASDSVDFCVAISSIEHMFSAGRDSDEKAVETIARVLKPGGMAVVTVPMSNGMAFHECPEGDARYSAPYRLYTPEVLRARYLSNSRLETVQLSYLASTVPDSRYSNLHFHKFWLESLTDSDRRKWFWAFPIFSAIFNPVTTAEEGERRPRALNTALICFRKLT
jgi:SAM-dependent methyltransferase